MDGSDRDMQGKPNKRKIERNEMGTKELLNCSKCILKRNMKVTDLVCVCCSLLCGVRYGCEIETGFLYNM